MRNCNECPCWSSSQANKLTLHGGCRFKCVSALRLSCLHPSSLRWELLSLQTLAVTKLRQPAASPLAMDPVSALLDHFGQFRFQLLHFSLQFPFLAQVVHGALLPLALPSSPAGLLAKSFSPLLARLSPHSWDCLQASSLWNLRRPVWLQALCRLIEPWIAPAVVGLLRGVEEGRTWTLAHLEKARKLLVTELADLLQILPPALAHLLLQINSKLPSNVKSLGGSACSHIIFATIYTSISNLLPELRKARVGREKIDFLIAFCENLCNLDIVGDILWVNECLTSSLQVAPHSRNAQLEFTSGSGNRWLSERERWIDST